MKKDKEIDKKKKKSKGVVAPKGFKLDIDRVLEVWGRPEEYDPSACIAIIVSAAKGRHMDSWAIAAGAKSRQTLYNWEERHPEFKEAMDYARLISRDFYGSAGAEATLGNIPNFNANTWATIVKNKFPDEWGQSTESSGGSTTNINFNTVNLTSDEKVNKVKSLIQQLKQSGHELGNIYDAERIESDSND